MNNEKIAAALSLCRRLPPSKLHKNALALSNLIPELSDDLLSKIDKPLEIGIDVDNGNNYLKCEFNRDGDSYRSHWTNKYDPPLEQAVYPSTKLRDLEVIANALMQEYTKLYYSGGISSTYLWDTVEGGFGLAFLAKKDVEHTDNITKGSYDSINVVEVQVNFQTKKAIYKITSSVVLEMAINEQQSGDVDISGTLSKAKTSQQDIEGINPNLLYQTHLERIGKLIEELESELRHSLDNVYVGKTKESVFTIRSVDGSYALLNLKRGLGAEIGKNK